MRLLLRMRRVKRVGLLSKMGALSHPFATLVIFFLFNIPTLWTLFWMQRISNLTHCWNSNNDNSFNRTVGCVIPLLFVDV